MGGIGMEYMDALGYIYSFINYEKNLDKFTYEEKKFYLERMKHLLNLMGNPQNNFKSIHIAGTKGKGSTSAFIFSVLKEAGYKVGLYTSPHLQTLRERIRIDSGLISKEELVELVNIAKPYIEEAKKHPIYGSPTFFEVLTALSFLYFFIKKVDFAVIEVGLGGRLDATNVILPLISVITPIGYDHMHILGNTLSQIAFEKAGIIKENIPVISSLQEEEAWNVIKKVAIERRAPIIKIDEKYSWQRLSFSNLGQEFSINDGSNEKIYFIPLLGNHQIINAVTAYGVFEVLKSKYFINIDNESIKKGFSKVEWRGRFQILKENPMIVLDGAHNISSAKALKDTVTEYTKYDRLFLICGMMKDKDTLGFVSTLDPLVYSYHFVPLPSNRTRKPDELSEMVRSFSTKDTFSYVNFKEAYEDVIKKASPTDLILITGSLYLVGEALDYFFGKLD
jgi:dihydrofolate synthase/folylpolyglutamate synthase